MARASRARSPCGIWPNAHRMVSDVRRSPPRDGTHGTRVRRAPHSRTRARSCLKLADGADAKVQRRKESIAVKQRDARSREHRPSKSATPILC